jgi:hypothetical protein
VRPSTTAAGVAHRAHTSGNHQHAGRFNMTTTPSEDRLMPRRNAALDSRDRRLIELMVTGRTQRESAELTGMHRTTVQRRAKRSVFQHALAVAEADVSRTARRKLSASLTAMADVLVRHAKDPHVPPAVRVAAAGRLLSVWAALEPRQLDTNVSFTAPPPGQTREEVNRMFNELHERLKATEGLHVPTQAEIEVHERRVPSGNGARS